tara:strand:+ start:2165 stop:2710 length:546 start_codon:yes stop_codon:yes gene_type:complete
MIRGEHSFIRGTEQDDVEALFGLYAPGVLRAGLLDARREPLLVTRDDLRDLLTRKEIADGSFYTVESKTGAIVGFCSIRGLNTDARFAEYGIQFTDTDCYGADLAREVHDFLLDRAFKRLGLRKVIAHALTEETAMVEFLRGKGFMSAGVQREILFSQGTWHHLETLVLNNPSFNASQAVS